MIRGQNFHTMCTKNVRKSGIPSLAALHVTVFSLSAKNRGVADIGPHAGHAGAGAILTEVSIFEEKKTVTGCIAKCL